MTGLVELAGSEAEKHQSSDTLALYPAEVAAVVGGSVTAGE